MLQLYHGTNRAGANSIIEHGIDLKVCSLYSDFGRGFYATTDIGFAYKCGTRQLDSEHDEVSLVKLCFDIDRAESYIRRFNEYSVSWAQFVINNRNGWEYVRALGLTDHNLLSYNHICIEGTADGDVVGLTRELSKKQVAVSEEDIPRMLRERRKQYPTQYSFHTEEALSFIGIIGTE